ncbi:MAG TPA: hypothetical protein VNN80_15780, partial [Polyangiaceae bacterium]|nr:hypothetical protein [Polyangiaceae bacterium]
MNDSSSSSSRPPAGAPADAPVVSELGGVPRPSSPDPLGRVRRRWMGLIAAVVAALLAPQLLAAPDDAQSMAIGWVALGGGLLLLGAARLAFDHLIAPELRAPELTPAELEGQGA